MKTAILVDGGYYKKVAISRFGKKSARESAEELITYCKRHLKYGPQKEPRWAELYRIFYYDCPPTDKKVYHPLLDKTVDLAQTEEYKWTNEFLNELTKKRKVALRLGRLSEIDINYLLTYEAVKNIVRGKVSVSGLSNKDFYLSIKQKGVDMKIGVDIASLAYKKQVDQIVLIAGDSDFVPAAKLARREGIDFVLDSLGRNIKSDLFEHIDGLNCKDERLKMKNVNK